MNKLLVICGPTATGKTSLALHLASVLNGELISADSRQVYGGMDIGTGKDIPPNSKFEFRNSKIGGYYLVNKIRLWGYDLVEPNEDFSVAQYSKIATSVISDIRKRGKLPILVGGTGFYIQAVIEGVETASIPQDQDLRNSLENKAVNELFDLLTKINFSKANSLNESDKKNPRRLIRAIEIASINPERSPVSMNRFIDTDQSVLLVGLFMSMQALTRKINERAYKRVNQGIINEIKTLLASGVSWDDQSMTSLGYKQWRGYLERNSTKRQAIEEWQRAERRYAKRQLTWFMRDKRINWFEAGDNELIENVEKLVNKWHNT